MRAKDAVRLLVIRGIKSAILAAETRAERITLEDDGILQVITKEVKERQESLAEFERAGRQDLVDKMHQELRVLQEYLPQPLTDEELRQLVNQAVTDSGASSPRDMGQVMAILQPQTRGRADGRVVAEMVKARLQQ